MNAVPVLKHRLIYYSIISLISVF